RVDVELPSMASGTGFSKRTEEMMTVVRELLPSLVDAVNALFKRHMVRVSYEIWRPDDEQAAVTHERTVGFADIVGSTETVRSDRHPGRPLGQRGRPVRGGRLAIAARARRRRVRLRGPSCTRAEGVRRSGDLLPGHPPLIPRPDTRWWEGHAQACLLEETHGD